VCPPPSSQPATDIWAERRELQEASSQAATVPEAGMPPRVRALTSAERSPCKICVLVSYSPSRLLRRGLATFLLLNSGQVGRLSTLYSLVHYARTSHQRVVVLASKCSELCALRLTEPAKLTDSWLTPCWNSPLGLSRT
jgi:hypothetical protein